MGRVEQFRRPAARGIELPVDTFGSESVGEAEPSRSERCILLLLDPLNVRSLETGSTTRLPFSHDLNLLRLAHEALRAGYQVYASNHPNSHVASRQFHRITAIYPSLRTEKFTSGHSLMPDAIFTALPQLVPPRESVPRSSLVLFESAVHELEVPHAVDASWVHNYARGVSRAHHILTQNDRMRELISLKVSLTTGTDRKRDIRIAPLWLFPEEVAALKVNRSARLQARTKLGIPPGDRVIVNAGGVWPWTDFDTLLAAWATLPERSAERLWLLLPGLGQGNSEEQRAFHRGIELAINVMSRTHRSRILLSRNWEEGRLDLSTFLEAADFGLNVNRDGLEAWQAFRTRSLDYIRHLLPTITTGQDPHSSEMQRDFSEFVRAGDPTDYAMVLCRLAESNQNVLDARREELREFVQASTMSQTYTDVFKEVVSDVSTPSTNRVSENDLQLGPSGQRTWSLLESTARALKIWIVHSPPRYAAAKKIGLRWAYQRLTN